MLRTHTCGELRIDNVGEEVILTGWVQRLRDKGGMLWIDLRDRYGITQLSFEEGMTPEALLNQARSLGREYVIRVVGKVIERESKNDKIPTGAIELKATKLEVLNAAKLPPFMIEDETDGGDDLRMKYRYLDLRRNPVRRNLELRHRVMRETRNYLDGHYFIEVETPVLIKSTPEGARDFVVPSRMNPGEFYALPQSPQTFKQLLMVSGFDKYYQIVKCFRDEDLRADRQPEFTQIDCELSFVTQEDILNTFEGLIHHLFHKVKGINLPKLPRMTYADAMRLYGSDKPDTRFGMQFEELNSLVKNKGFKVFDDAELIVGINATGAASYTRKQLDELTDFVKRPQIDCELSFVTQEDILNTFEGLIHHLFHKVKGINLPKLPRMTYADAMRLYGSDKPDTRFGMQFEELNSLVKNKGFKVFDDAELIVGINATGAASYTRKQLDELTDFVKRPQIGATGLVYARVNEDGTVKSSVDKFYSPEDLAEWAKAFNAKPAPDVILYYWQTDNKGIYANKAGLDPKAERHGYIRGWVKTDKHGKYTIYTNRPASYPNSDAPTHIHMLVKEPSIKNEYYIDDIMFADDPLLPKGTRDASDIKGGSGVVKVTKENGIQRATRDIILGQNIENYPNQK